MNHADVESRMADYLEGDLPLEQRALFDAHLDSCPPCADELHAMRATIAALKHLPEPEVPPQLANDVMRRIRLGEGRAGWWDRASMWLEEVFPPRFAIPATAAATAALILVVTGQVDLSGIGLPGFQPAPIVVAQSQDPSVRFSIEFSNIEPEALAEFVGQGSNIARYNAARPSSRRSTTGFQAPPRAANVSQGLASADPFRASPLSLYGNTHGFAATPTATRVLDKPDNHTLGWHRSLAPATNAAVRDADADQVLDDRLRRLRRSPVAFARRQSQLSLAERELWARQLAQRAEELGIFDDVVGSLDATGNADAVILAGALRDQSPH